MSAGEDMALDEEFAALRQEHKKLRGEFDDLAEHVEGHVNPLLARLKEDSAEMRAELRVLGVKIDSCATKNDVIALMKKIDEGNVNMAAAISAVPADQAKASFNLGMASSMAVVVAGIAAIGGIVYAIIR